MIIATYNINSIRIRLESLKQVAEKTQADIICLQEIKVEDASFPLDAVQALGFPHCYISGQKSYHGVAMLSKIPLTHIQTLSFDNHGHKRHISGTLPNGIEIHNFYAPAGGDIPDATENEKFRHKLEFYAAMKQWSESAQNTKMIMVGDMNIAPLEHDVWSHKQLLKIVSHTPIEVAAMQALQEALHWIDTSRHFSNPQEKLYSWWSYRNKDWKKSDRGRRLDHIWVTPDLKDSLHSSYILKEARDFANPSDHVPVVTQFSL